MLPAALLLMIIATSVVLLITERIPMEAIALLVLGSLAVTGLVTPSEAVSGFSNPAVVTVWAVFILSGGLTRTGVAGRLGRHVLRLAGNGEARVMAAVMLCASGLSAFMSTIAVAAMMLPVVMDISRQTGHPPSRLMLPLAYGSMLGGLTTLIGRPSNLLASEILRENGLMPFGFFDFAPVGLAVMTAGVAFMALAGRRLLPRRNVAVESSADGGIDLREQYSLEERLFHLRVPAGSPLAGRTLTQSRIGKALGLLVLGIRRDRRSRLAPGHGAVLQGGDLLLVQGRLDRMAELSGWRGLELASDARALDWLADGDADLAEVRLAAGSELTGRTVVEVGFRRRYGVNVLALRRADGLPVAELSEAAFLGGDHLLVHGPRRRIRALKGRPDFDDSPPVSRAKLAETYQLERRLLPLRVRAVSGLADTELKSAGLADALGLRVLRILRADDTPASPEPDTRLKEGDRLLALGRREEWELLRALVSLPVEREMARDAAAIESERIGLMEAVLSPRSALAGKRAWEVQFRARFGVSLLAIWRDGRPHRSNLQDMELRHGDALLLYGPREQLQRLGREPDFIVLTQAAQELPRSEKAGVALAIMGAVILSAVLGLAPVYIAAVVGAALMVATRCLDMTEAYRSIQWKAVFLMAGLLPLGIAVEKTGVAGWIAGQVVAAAGPLGPLGLLAGLLLLTVAGSCLIPPVALVVLLAPVVLEATETLGYSPRAFLMAVAVAAASTFVNPVAHPANVLVMGPGGYRFADYIKVGLPLTAVILAAGLLVLPLVWPLTP